jgi:hypothetical protein
MLALVGRPLARLHRVAFANLVVEEEGSAEGTELLPCGQCRELTEREVMEIYSLADAAVAAAANADEDIAVAVACADGTDTFTESL